MTPRPHSDSTCVYIAACASSEEAGGVYRYEFREGRLDFLDLTPMDRPMYLARENGCLYVLLRAPYGGDREESALAVYQLLPDGRIGERLSLTPTDGIVACHHSVVGEDVYAVNYLSGNVSLVGRKTVTHEPIPLTAAMNPKRQEMPHTHCIIPSPDSRYMLVADLGLDTVFVYDRALAPISSARVPEGYGARHLVFSRDGGRLFCVNELKASVTLFLFEEGHLTYVQTVSCGVDEIANPDNTAAAIRLSADERYLYVSNRGADTVTVFDVAAFSPVASVPTGGRSPRDIILAPDGQSIICANMNSNTATVLSLREGIPGEVSAEVSLPAPLAVIF